MSLHDPIADQILTDYLGRLADSPQRAEIASAQNTVREILIVNKVVHTVSNFVPSSTQTTPDCRAEFTLTGYPSASSEVEKAYLRFVPRAALSAPVYNNKTIHLFVDETFMEPALATLGHAHVYCWIGGWSNGHIYADIHAHQ